MSRIVVAEDDPHILRVICFWLGKQGHETLEARDGRAALELVVAHKPDVLITDVNMPHMTGLELIAELNRGGHTPRGIVVLTNRWDHREIGARLAASEVCVIPKPFSPSALADRIEQIVNPQPATAGDGGI